MKYRTPLPVRLRKANAKRRRYWSDPQRRLARVNAHRASRGLPPASSVEEIFTPRERGQFIAAQRQRDERGRLL